MFVRPFVVIHHPVFTRMYTLTHAHTHTNILSLTYSHTYSHTHTHTHTHYSHSHSHTHILTYSHTYSHTHTHTHTHTRTRRMTPPDIRKKVKKPSSSVQQGEMILDGEMQGLLNPMAWENTPSVLKEKFPHWKEASTSLKMQPLAVKGDSK